MRLTSPTSAPVDIGEPCPDVVGLAWFRKEDFPALIAMFEDGLLFDSFEQWQKRAEETERWFV